MSDSLLRTGTQVKFRSPELGLTMPGIVVMLPHQYYLKAGDLDQAAEFSKYQVLVCAYEPHPRHTAFADFTMEGYGALVDRRSMSPTVFRSGREKNEAYHQIPPHIGITPTEDFSHDGVIFHRGVTGRIISTDGHALCTVSWNFRNEAFRSEGVYRNCFSVPLRKLRWCRLSPDKEVLKEWPESFPTVKYKVGDLVVVRSGRHVSCITTDSQELLIPDGAVAEIKAQKSGSCRVRLVGGCEPRFLDAEAGLRTEFLRPLQNPDLFFHKGTEVEIVADLSFRKFPLQGRRAKVLLPTDTDGDVGLVLDEDIGAGSLDGLGPEGRCVYVGAGALKASE